MREKLAIARPAQQSAPTRDGPRVNNEIKAPRAYVGGTPKISVTENGPARVAVTISRQLDSSTFVQTIRLGRYPTAVAWGLGSVWVANNEDGTISRVDPLRGRVVATIPVGPRPTAIAVGAGGVWVAVHPA